MTSEAREEGDRRLGAIMFTDVVGYSSIASSDEESALRLLEEHRKVIRPVIGSHRGIEIKTIGDAFLVEFASAVQAVNCAVEMQKVMGAFNAAKAPGERMQIRIGIHVGDIVHEQGDVLGDAVNVAARVEPLAEPGGICVTRQVVDQVERKVKAKLLKLGNRELKNIGHPVEIYRVIMNSETEDGSRPALDSKRVAILPFTNMSSDPEDRYFAEGLTEELISTVSKIRELQVISRTSVMRYRDTTEPISQIGQDLSVGTVLEGSVRKAGNKVRITAQLIEVKGDKHLWAQSYDRDLTDIFAIQGDIAEQVAGSLRVALLADEKEEVTKPATDDPEAYTIYLKGRFHWSERSKEGTRTALKYFQQASRLDPGFAMAYSGIADCYNILSDYGWMDPVEAGPLAKANAARALQIDDSLAEAHASLGLTLCNLDWDMDGADRELKKAIQLKPNYAPGHHWRAVNLFYMRRYGESLEEERFALQLDPYSRTYAMSAANMLLLGGDPRQAVERQAQLVQTYPDFGALRYWKTVSHVMLGQYNEAEAEARRYMELDGGSWGSKLRLGWVYACAGRKEEAETLVAGAVAARKDVFVSPGMIAWVYLALGRKDEGYQWLLRAHSEKDPSILEFNAHPAAKEFRRDQRWAAIEGRFRFRSAPDLDEMPLRSSPS